MLRRVVNQGYGRRVLAASFGRRGVHTSSWAAVCGTVVLDSAAKPFGSLDEAPRFSSSHRPPPPGPSTSRTSVRWEVMVGRETPYWSGASQQKPSHDSTAAPSNDLPELQGRLLDETLRLVPSLGWTGAAMAQGAANCGLSTAAAGLLGDSPGDLVQVFLRHCNLQLEEVLQDDPAVGGLAEKIEHGLRKRLEMILPYKGSWPGALAALGPPRPEVATLYMEAAEIVLKSTGQDPLDDEVGFSLRKTALSGVLATTELYLLTDDSPRSERTWQALRRAVAEALRLVGMADAAAAAVGSLRNTVAANIFQKAFSSRR